MFLRATTSAAERERATGTQLHVRIGALDVATDVRVEVGPVEDHTTSSFGHSVASFPLRWSAAANASLFPRMKAKLSVYSLSRSETQLDLEGTYDPPFGLLGDAIDGAIGHRLAEASIRNFLRDVATLLCAELASG